MTKTLYVDKRTGTFADQLTAFGLARLAQDVLRRVHDDRELTVTLRDRGPYYELALDAPLDDATLDRFEGGYMPIKALVTKKRESKLPAEMNRAYCVFYEAERDRRAAYFEQRNNLSSEAKEAQKKGVEHPELLQLRENEPHPDWDIFRAINPAALLGYNKLVLQWWQMQPSLAPVFRLIRDLYMVSPNDLRRAESDWKALDKEMGWGIDALATSGQIYSPAMGKGQNRTKANKLTMGNVKGLWLSEFLSAVGYYQAAHTRNPRGTKDRKTYVLAPTDLRLSDHYPVFAAFQRAMQASETTIRSDVFAMLRYTQELLGYAVSDHGGSVLSALLQTGSPNRLVAGFGSALYKNLGNAVATMNLPFMGLPGWLCVQNRDDVETALNILREHERVVRGFDESHSDDVGLLLQYRNFCSGDNIEAFLRFTGLYSAFVISQREKSRYAHQFTTTNLGRLLMNSEPKLEPILESEGFQNIAYAIRQSTVTAQYKRRNLNDRRYEVRYGLGQQLMRKAHHADTFVAELSEFMLKYNAENAQVMENRQGPYRKSLRTSDIDEIVALIDAFGPETVCGLLVAYGYARVPRDENEEAIQEQ